MAKWSWSVCVAAALIIGGSAQGQEPQRSDPFADPFFNPPGTIGYKPPPAKAEAPKKKPPQDLIFAGSIFDVIADDPLPPPVEYNPPPDIGPQVCVESITTWFTAEWVFGMTRGPSLLPVVTVGSPLPILGQNDSVPLFGGRSVVNDWRSGIRLEAGIWCADDFSSAFNVRFYALYSLSERFYTLPGFPATLQVPVVTGLPAVPTGDAAASAQTIFAGGDATWSVRLNSGERGRIMLHAGYQQLYLGDSLDTAFNATPIAVNPVLATQVTGSDRLSTRNNFYGPHLRLSAGVGGERCSLDLYGATALGVTVSYLNATSARNLTVGVPGVGMNILPVPQPNFNNTLTYFGVVSESGARLRWRAADHLWLTGGYSFMYWNNVRRAPEMFGGTGSLRPQAIDFTAHLVSFGLELKY